MILQPDPHIISARLAVLIASPSEQILGLWTGLKNALAAYDVAITTSLSSEGVSRSMDAAAAAKQVAEWLLAYQTAVAALTQSPDTDPILLASPYGFTVDHSRVPLRF